ncbi:MAG: NAD(P)(+) transhydrogenase (Re/Si-specific) subunit alpha, partial [Hyphomicrobiales bacterium]|nr:NAD(P)(+) transhydrogenase (Re/Si-specific) subunit alpha [Hyphomicrobiales bacterium]
MPQVIGIPKEIFPGEKRVAIAPDVVQKLVGLGFSVQVEKGAGDAADIYDDALTAAGATIADSAAAIWSTSDIVFKVRAPTDGEVAQMKE